MKKKIFDFLPLACAAYFLFYSPFEGTVCAATAPSKMTEQEQESYLDRLIAQNPDSPLLNKEMGYLLVARGDYERSLKFLLKAEKLDPNDATLSLQIGYVLQQLHRYKEAVEQFKKAAKFSDPKIQRLAKTGIKNLTPLVEHRELYPSIPNELVGNKTLDEYFQLKESNPGAAEAKMEALLTQYPESGYLNAEMGYFLADQKKYERSLKYLYKAERLNPNDPLVVLEIGYVLQHLERYDEAILQFKKAERFPQPEITSTAKAGVRNLTYLLQPPSYPTAPSAMLENKDLNRYFQLKSTQPKAAETILLKLLQETPDSPFLNAEMGYFLASQKRYKQSLIYLNKAHLLKPEDEQITLQIGYILLEEKKYYDSINQFRKLLNNRNQAVAQRAQKAIQNIAPLVNPVELPPYMVSPKLLDEYFLIKKENFPEALEKLNILLCQDPDSFFLNKEMGYLLLGKEEYAPSLFFFQRAEQINPTDEQNILQVGYTLDKLEFKEEAIFQFEKVLGSQDKDVVEKALDALLYLKMARFYKIKEKDKERAYDLLSQLAIIYPKDPQVNVEMAVWLLDINLPREAYFYGVKSFTSKPSAQAGIAIGGALHKLKYHFLANDFLTALVNAYTGKDRCDICKARYYQFNWKTLCEPLFLEIYGVPTYYGRFKALVNYYVANLGLAAWETKLQVYFHTLYSKDTKSKSPVGEIFVGLPLIFADNVLILSAGVRSNPFKDFPITFYAEGGMAFDLLDLGRPPWSSDFRGGVYYYRLWLDPPRCCSQLISPMSRYREIYGNITYYSRYRDGIGYLSWREGLVLLELRDTNLRIYGRGFLAADLQHQYYNNYFEIGPGIALFPSYLMNAAIRYEWIAGYYLPVQSPTPNPFGPRYHDNRIQIDFYFNF